MKLERFFLNTLSLFAFASSQCFAVCYVNQHATGKNDGSSWANAYSHPQFALLSGCEVVWVAKGVYTPAGLSSDPTISFDIPPGTRMYGGFGGYETNVDQRLPTVNLTVLSGDVDGNDEYKSDDHVNHDAKNIRGRNSNHVLRMLAIAGSPITSSTVLDGFTISGGQAQTGEEWDDGYGGGLLCEAKTAECSPIVAHCSFVGNFAEADGGAIATHGDYERSDIVVTETNFEGNLSGRGGAVALETSGRPQFGNVSFIYNQGETVGGALYDPWGVSTVRNATFVKNVSNEGGAIYYQGIGGLNTPLITNATFLDNSAKFDGSAISNFMTSSKAMLVPAFIINSIFWSNSTESPPQLTNGDSAYIVINNSVVRGGCPDAQSVCASLQSQDPKLSSPTIRGGTTVTVLPGAGGSAIDNGEDLTCTTGGNVDQRNVLRPQGPHCDIGAVEWIPSDDVIFQNGFE